MENKHRPHLQESPAKTFPAQEVQGEDSSSAPFLHSRRSKHPHLILQSGAVVLTHTPGKNYCALSTDHPKSLAPPSHHWNHFTTNGHWMPVKSSQIPLTLHIMLSSYCPLGGAIGHCNPKQPASETVWIPTQYELWAPSDNSTTCWFMYEALRYCVICVCLYCDCMLYHVRCFCVPCWNLLTIICTENKKTNSTGLAVWSLKYHSFIHSLG